MKASAKLIATVVFVIAAVLLSIIAFLLLEETDYFWVTYAFTLAAASLLFAVALYYLSDKNRTFREFPANAPYAYVAIQYAVAEAILAAAFCLIGGLTGLKIIYFVCAELVLALVFGIRIVLAFGAKAAVMDVENTARKNTQSWGMIAADVRAIQSRSEALPLETRAEVSRILHRLFEAVRYSDPVSDNSLSVIESQMRQGIANIGEEIDRLLNGQYADTDKTKAAANAVERLIEDRNNRVKILKK